MKIEPNRGKVLIEVDAPDQETKGGIILAGGGREFLAGTICGVGGDYPRSGMMVPTWGEVGWRVWFSTYDADKRMKYNGKEFIIICNEDILGRLLDETES